MRARRSTRLAALLALPLVGSLAGAAAARDAIVLVVSAGPGDPVTPHLVDELISLGVTVEVTPGQAGDLAALGRARKADAVLRVASSRRAVDLWVDPGGGSGPAAADHLEEERGGSGDPAAALALRAVELLRGGLLRVERPSSPLLPSPAPSPSPSTLEPKQPPLRPATAPAAGSAEPASPPRPPGTRTGRVSLYVLPSALVQPASGVSLSGAAVGGVRAMLAPRWGADLFALASVVPGTVEAPAGVARISAVVIALGAHADLLGPGLPVSSGLGAGVGAGFMSYDAKSTSPAVRGNDGTIAYALPYLRWVFEWRALPPLGLRAEALVGIAAPRPVIRLEGRDRDAIFGRPLLAFGLGPVMTIP